MLISYQGYTDAENWALNFAAVGLLGVLFFPMDWPVDRPEPQSVREKVHIASAIVFFVGIAYVSLFRAHDTLDHMTDEKRVRLYRNLYRFTGVMMACVPLIWYVLYKTGVKSTVYVVEFCGVYFFLSFWVIKNIELRSAGGVEKEGQIERVAAEAQAVQRMKAVGQER